MSRVKHTILRLSQNATTLADALVREAGMLYRIRTFVVVGPAPGQDLILKACSKNPLGRYVVTLAWFLCFDRYIPAKAATQSHYVQRR